MDRSDKFLDNSNLPSERPLSTVPTFSLYGEHARPALPDWLHCETIPARSRLHDWKIRPHRHANFFQILYLAGGAGECILDGWSARLVPASAVTVMPGAIHGFRFSRDVQGWVLTLMADRAAAAMAAAGMQHAFVQAQSIPLGTADAARAVGGCIETINDELSDRRPGRDALIEAQLRSVLVLLGRHLPGEAHGPAPRSPLGLHAEQFRLLLNRHFRTERSLGFYAGRLGVSETHLNRICRAVVGRSALGVIHDRIVEEAEAESSEVQRRDAPTRIVFEEEPPLAIASLQNLVIAEGDGAAVISAHIAR